MLPRSALSVAAGFDRFVAGGYGACAVYTGSGAFLPPVLVPLLVLVLVLVLESLVVPEVVEEAGGGGALVVVVVGVVVGESVTLADGVPEIGVNLVPCFESTFAPLSVPLPLLVPLPLGSACVVPPEPEVVGLDVGCCSVGCVGESVLVPVGCAGAGGSL